MSGNDMAERFARDTANHEMTVLHDDGLYRHLRFKNPERSEYWFDLVTWPGVLAINGDMDGYVFSRIADMFQFFRSDYGINPDYWAEKLVAHSSVKAYSEDLFRQSIAEHIEDYAADHPGLAGAVKEEILDSGDLYYEEGARAALDEFEHNGFRFEDTGEWDFREYTARYLWCCHAIVWGIGQYDSKRAAAQGGGA